MLSVLEWSGRRRDERLLEAAIRLGAMAEPVSDELRAEVESFWRAVCVIPRWRSARVTLDNAEARLRDSRDGLRYTETGYRVTTRWRDRWWLRREVRRMRAQGTPDALEAALVYEGVLAEGYPPPADWDSGRS